MALDGANRLAIHPREGGFGAEVTGVDLLTTLGPHDDGFTFVQADLRALPFADGRFDLAIAANDPFAHLLEDADRTQALNEAARVASRAVIDGLALTPAPQRGPERPASYGGLSCPTLLRRLARLRCFSPSTKSPSSFARRRKRSTR